ncbi:PR domain zinc finger protein 5 [Pseudolycoriella hygida]|uniref:PR domain zinc finger protein 5 n=1 Tax=Pseudolycoriella hygida TaxID=35572 RepID=A0A9Q0N0B9_9DIPT|nr:PR domain zinc finger protein 5 [Pseudolycoriella hygida]
MSASRRSRQCLMNDIIYLDTQLTQLRMRFDLIVNWIRSQYFDLKGLPENVVNAVRGNEGLSTEKNETFKEMTSLDDFTEQKAIEKDRREDLSTLISVTELAGETMVSGCSRNQLQKHKLAYRRKDFKNKYEERCNGDYNSPDATTQADVELLPPVIVEVEENFVKEENFELNDEDCRIDSSDAVEYTDEKLTNNSNSMSTFTISYDNIGKIDWNSGAPSSVDNGTKSHNSKGSKINKQVKKTAKHIEANRKKGLILDAFGYMQLISLLPKERTNCAVCNKTFSTLQQIRRHELEVHLMKEDRKKVICITSSRNVESAKTQPGLCEICNKTFRNIKSHKSNHLPPEVITLVEGRLQYRCLKCELLLSTKKSYLDHVHRDCNNGESLENSNYAAHHLTLRTQKTFLCNICGHVFNRKHSLQIHQLSVHAKKRDFKCQFCEKSFSTEYLKKCHEKKHLGMSEVICDLCGFKFTCKQILRKHIMGVHQNYRPFQCQLCDKRFKTSHSRNYHVNTHGNPNGRKRGLNKDIDPIKAAAKRRHCSAFKRNRLQKVMKSDTEIS